MQAVQFETAISNGIIKIPKEYYSRLSPIVEVIILSKKLGQTNFSQQIKNSFFTKQGILIEKK